MTKFGNKNGNNDACSYERVAVPTAIDVLCGTGMEKYHTGNELFKRKVSEFIELYANAQSKKEKMEITKTIIDEMTGKGVRFLKKSSVYQFWYVAKKKAGRDKIGHFLRHNVPQQKCAIMPSLPRTSVRSTNHNQSIPTALSSSFASPFPGQAPASSPGTVQTLSFVAHQSCGGSISSPNIDWSGLSWPSTESASNKGTYMLLGAPTLHSSRMLLAPYSSVSSSPIVKLEDDEEDLFDESELAMRLD